MLRLTISKEMVTTDTDSVIGSIAITSVLEALFLEAEELDVVALCTASTPSICADHGFLGCSCGLATGKDILL